MIVTSQTMHNNYCRKFKFKDGIIGGIKVKGGWYGFYDKNLGCVFQKDADDKNINTRTPLPKRWEPRFGKNKEINFPYQQLLNFDKKNGTHYAFNADIDFDDAAWRFMMKNDSDLAKAMSKYAWHNYIYKNIEAKHVLLCRLTSARDPEVNCVPFCMI